MMNTSSYIQPTPLSRRSTSSLLVTFVAALFAAIALLLVAVERTDAQAQVEVWAWGDNAFGQLGTGTTTQRNTPTQLSGFSDVQTIAGGFYHSLALKSDGTVWAWGRNNFGQLGDRTATDSNTPVQVSEDSGLSGVQAIDGGFYHSLALKSDGTVWAWGYNTYRQLGDGTTTNSSTPVQVRGLSEVKAISSGGHHGLALKNDDTLWAWGKNEFGALGDGTTTNSSTPVQVKGPNGEGFLSEVQAIAGGQLYSLGLKKDGTVWAWGRNNWGQLGDGTTTNRSTPVQVRGLSEVQAIAAGHYHSLALKKDGTLWAWGRNNYGQLGTGTTTDSNTPVQVKGFSDEQAIIAAGYYHNLTLKSDGTLWAWGRNEYGQLGIGTATQRNIPVQVSGLSGVQAIDGGGNHSLAVTSSDTTPPPTDPVPGPPTVESTIPTAEAPGVDRTTNVTATFSEDMDASSINTPATTFKLFKKGSTTKIAATVSYDPTTRIATLNPFGSTTTRLARGTTYKAVVTTGAKDLAGNQLDQNPTLDGLQQKTWFFTTTT
jgi:alpha-tubulin suppressor-like RCC1 family protein